MFREIHISWFNGLLMGLIALLTSACCRAQIAEMQPPSDESIAAVAADDPIVAQSGSMTLTRAQYHQALRDFVVNNPYDMEDFDTLEELERHVIETMLTDRAEEQEARDAGCENDPQYLAARRLLWVSAMAGTALAKETSAADHQPTEEELRGIHEKRRERVKQQNAASNVILFHYIFFNALNLDETARAEKRQLAERALQRLQDGETFFTVMESMSEAETVRRQPLRITPDNPAYSEGLYETLKALQDNEISEIVDMPTGFCIFQIAPSRKTPKLSTFEEALADPKQKEALIEQGRMNYSREKKQALSERFEQLSIDYPFDFSSGDIPDDPDTVVLRIGDDKLRFGEVRDMILFRSNAIIPEKMPNLLSILAQKLMLARDCQQRGWVDQAQHTREWISGIRDLNRTYLSRKIQSTLTPPTEEEIRALYEERKDSHYRPMVLNAYQIVLKPVLTEQNKKISSMVVREEAKRIREMLLEEGASFESVVANYHNDDYTIETKTWDKTLMHQVEFADRTLGASLAGKTNQPQVKQCPKGFAIFAVTERGRRDPPIPLEEVHDKIALQLNQKALYREMNAIGNGMRDGLVIDSEKAAVSESLRAQLDIDLPSAADRDQQGEQAAP